MPSITSLLALLLSATTLYAQTCQAPTITQPTSSTNAPSTFTLSGFVVPNTDCADGLVRIMTEEAGQIRLAPTDANGQFSVRLINGPYGTQHYYLLHTSDTNGTLRSNVVAITTTCGVPTISSPSANSTSDTTISQSRVNVTGFSDCPFVTIHLSGQNPITVATDVYGSFNVQSRYLPNGRYSISAVASSDRQGSTAASSEERKVVVESDEPAPTAFLQRRSQTVIPRCGAEEELCRFHGVGRSRKNVEYKCYPDLSSNLERCGSCGGPDCSALPNVKDVSCQDARCKVHSCEDGFVLLGNACI